MIALTLPGDIPGLLVRGAPVLLDLFAANELGEDEDTRREDYQTRGVVYTDPNTTFCEVAYEACEGEHGGADEIALCWLSLDLSDPLGRTIAAQWANERITGPDIASPPEMYTIGLSLRREPMTDTQIATLRDLVLRMAGRAS